VDIRPLGELISIQTARQQVKGGRPLPRFQTVPAWAQLSDISPNTTKATVFVHGFDNAESDVVTDNIPTYFKRLYWVNHPVLPAQKGMFVGISWPSNPGGTQFPVGEFLGLETGVPLACFLKDLKATNQQAINIVAHSLGNMVVNSALQRIQPGLVNNYLMNEAALPAEAFHDPTTDFQAGETFDSYVLRAQISYGYPNDADWAIQWNDMVAGRPFNDTLPDQTDYIQWFANILNIPVPQPQYPVRWTQKRPSGGVPDYSTDPIPRRGPWKGYFFQNLSKVSGRVVSTWSSNDGVLGVAPSGFGLWSFMEANQKPYIGTLGLSTAGNVANERKTQFWAQLGIQADAEEAVWAGGCDSSQPNHYNTVRQWAEVAMWFGSLSDAAGYMTTPNVTNIEFSTLGDSTDRGISHSYLTEKPFYDVKR
jgi:Alpha/beta hydrolase of unknown function (DUF900)